MNLGVNIEITGAEDFESSQSIAGTPAWLSVEPARDNLGWLFVAAALVLFVVAVIHYWS
jgi:hypothetical protein